MNDGVLHFAFRELRAELSKRNTWIILIAISMIVGSSGPFQTYEYMNTLPRIGYWGLVVAATFCLGSLVSDTLGRLLQSASVWLKLPIIIAAMSFTIALFITISNGTLLGAWPNALSDGVLHLSRVAPICAAIVLGSHFFETKGSESDAPKAPALLSRLPLEKRGQLIALSVSDHYVEVRTDKGVELILMRLRDAIKESAPTVGIQTHRSHWVSTDQIKKIERRGDRAFCEMSAGAPIPVSRSFMPKLRDAGLLPRGRNG